MRTDSCPAALLELFFAAPNHQAGGYADGDDQPDQPDFIECGHLEKDGRVGTGERRQRAEQRDGGNKNFHFSP